jgi:hypothetical protein
VALYTPEPNEAELAGLGLTLEDMATTEIWPDNVRACSVFQALGTQWRTGMGGPSGLDYAVIPVAMRLCNVPRLEWQQLFDDLRVMEAAALAVMHEKD